MQIVLLGAAHRFMNVIQMIDSYCRTVAVNSVALENFFSSKNLFIALTYQCNAFCEKCITRYNRFRNQSMTQENCHRLVKFLIENNYSGTINLGSGESLTYKFLPYFVEALLRNLPDIKFRILSNGMLLSSKLQTFFFSPRITWGITFDGFDNSELVDLQKGVDVETVKSNIESVCNAGFSRNLYLNYTMNNRNIKSLKAYIDFANEMNIPRLFTTEMKIYEGFKHLDKYRLSERDIENIKELNNYAKSLNFESVYFDKIETQHDRDKCFVKKGFVSPIIDMDCSVAFCYGQEDKLLGSIFNPNTIEKWNSLIENLRKDNLKAEIWCQKCFSKRNDYQYFSVPLSLNPYLPTKN